MTEASHENSRRAGRPSMLAGSDEEMARVVARELGLPAVVGVSGATRLIPDGATVEVDAATGQVQVL